MNFFDLNTKLAEIAMLPSMRVGTQTPKYRGVESALGPKMLAINEPEEAKDSFMKTILLSMHPEQTEREVIELLFHAIGKKHGWPVAITDMERYIDLRQENKHGAIKNIHKIPDEE